MVNWLNSNQGFAITILTFCYVLTTFFILVSNKKSADAALASNKQQVALQLLDRRLKSYYQLNKWISIAASLNIQNCPVGSAKDLFISMLYSNTNNDDIERLTKEIGQVQAQILHNGQASVNHSQYVMLLERLNQERFFKRFQLLSDENNLIGQIEVLFPSFEYKKIDAFCKCLFSTFVQTSDENISELILLNKELTDGDSSVIKSLWTELKVSD